MTSPRRDTLLRTRRDLHFEIIRIGIVRTQTLEYMSAPAADGGSARRDKNQEITSPCFRLIWRRRILL